MSRSMQRKHAAEAVYGLCGDIRLLCMYMCAGAYRWEKQ